jgi:peptidoglycan/LPS O-acetylase OafA/YrhL
VIGVDWRIASSEAHNRAAVSGLGQSWTLGAELAFYLMAPLLTRSWKIGVTLFCLSLAARAGFVVTNGPELQDL